MKAILFRVIPTLLCLIVLEGLCQITYWVRSGDHEWLFQRDRVEAALYQSHPFLAFVGRPNARVRDGNIVLSHNRLGYRGPAPRSARPAARIVTLGGSTTYGLGVSDGDTWPEQLGHALGKRYEVINFGMVGYSSVENVIQTALSLSDVAPTIAIYFLGWNDLHTSHIPNLDPYYASFHGALQQEGFGPLTWSAAAFYLRTADRYLVAAGHGPPAIRPTLEPTVHPLVDERALGLFRRNVHTIATLCRLQHVQAILVPNVYNCARLVTDDTEDPWSPQIHNRDICALGAVYASALATVAHEEQITFVSAESAHFVQSDFIDEGHFGVSGSAKFAALLIPAILQTEASPTIQP